MTNVLNVTVNAPVYKQYRYPLSPNFTSIYITALPTNQTNYSSSFHFAYSLESSVYPVSGGDWEAQQLALEAQ